MALRKTITLNLRTDDLDVFVDACSEAGWLIEDTGERIMTDVGPDAEAVIRVTVPARTGKAEREAVLKTIPC